MLGDGKGLFTSCRYRAQQYGPETTYPVIPGGVDNTQKQWGENPKNVCSEDEIIAADAAREEPREEIEGDTGDDVWKEEDCSVQSAEVLDILETGQEKDLSV